MVVGLSGRRRQGVGDSEFDERLTGNADSPGLSIDRVKQVDRKIDVHALNFTPWACCLRQIKVRSQVFARVVHFVETRRA